jgi:hypothetical protein
LVDAVREVVSRRGFLGAAACGVSLVESHAVGWGVHDEDTAGTGRGDDFGDPRGQFADAPGRSRAAV